MGSKKYPIDPISLLPVVGIAILNNSFIFFLLGISSFFLHLKLGILDLRDLPDYPIIMLDNSQNILDKITNAIAYSIPFLKKKGIPIIININLTKSSIILVIT